MRAHCESEQRAKEEERVWEAAPDDEVDDKRNSRCGMLRLHADDERSDRWLKKGGKRYWAGDPMRL